MKREHLDSLESIGIAFDCETWLTQPRLPAPPIVCASIACADGAKLLTPEQARPLFRKLIAPGSIIIGAHVVFDMAVMTVDAELRGESLIEEILDKYARDEVYDVLKAEMLDAIADGCLGKNPRTGESIPKRKNDEARYSLGRVSDFVLNRTDAKANDRWRPRYALLEGLPFESWPADAQQYPIDDAVNTWDVALAQCGLRPRGDGTIRRSQNLHALAEVCDMAFALHLGACWGFTIDQIAVDELDAEAREKIEAGEARFKELGFLREDGSKNTARIKKSVAIAYDATQPCEQCGGVGKVHSVKTGKPINCTRCSGSGLHIHNDRVPLTEGGKSGVRGIATARDVLVDSGDEDLYAFGEWGEDAKTISTYAPALRDGLPLEPNTPLVNERTSYGGIPQTMPRKGAVRDCAVARGGTVFSSVDFAGVEMATWAQVCIWIPEVGFSTLADVINATPAKDPHSILGADLCGRTYEEFDALRKAKDKMALDYRQASKWGNFGYAGGMGEVKFVLTNRKAPGMTTLAPDGTVYKGVRFCLLIGGAQRCGVEKLFEYKGRPCTPVCKACVAAAKTIRNGWRARWKEADPYFAYISKQVDNVGSIKHFVSNVVRGDVTFTQAANGYFSALAAVGARRAYRAVTRECYTDRSSPLWGSRPIAFIHDEIVTEHPEDRSHDAAVRVRDVMVREMQAIIPDVTIRAEPALMRRLYKGAEPVFVEGRLVPWEPRA